MIKKTSLLAVGLSAALAFAASAAAQEEKPKPQTLFINCNIFDGTADKLAENRRVLVEGNLIKTIGDKDSKAAKHAEVIDCGGRYDASPLRTFVSIEFVSLYIGRHQGSGQHSDEDAKCSRKSCDDSKRGRNLHCHVYLNTADN